MFRGRTFLAWMGLRFASGDPTLRRFDSLRAVHQGTGAPRVRVFLKGAGAVVQ